MPAAAGDFYRIARSFTVGTAIFTTLLGLAVCTPDERTCCQKLYPFRRYPPGKVGVQVEFHRS